ncbi:hypothetical protein GUJ93_ZPchr0002g23610 [Zizania palustris]|uniref:Homeobox domain-containing protein n=1 Tax=Zizania palustris TaxID=103762 RepID=A0A8J5VVK8_ZIZPA|nr:hypothetical protein GUJ93_ZPchr0002g23610 [Zizania palustris]
MSSSSLTTMSRSSMEAEAESVEEFDTRLSLELGGGGGGGGGGEGGWWSRQRRTPVVLFGELLLPPEPQQGEAEAARVDDHRHGRATTGERDQRGADAVAATRQDKSKKARTVHGDGDRRSPGGGDDDGARKKLRLTREQATLLEDSFHAHSILSHAQKHDLARQVELSARQVEVWFQNRRARTKLKQTEADCELLRRWTERLADENARLRHELARLRSSSTSSPVSRLAAAMATVVLPSCSNDDKRCLAPSAAAGDTAS